MKSRSTKRGKSTRKNTYRRKWTINPPSQGELKIQAWLNKNKIFHLTSVKFSDCVNPETGNIMEFDFYFPQFKAACEMDGSQHTEYTKKMWGTPERFEAGKRRDEYKNQYCMNKKIKLLRISYKDWDSIEVILEGFIKSLSKKKESLKKKK